jgi:hypothetical protein
MVKLAEFKAHEIATFLSDYGFETTFHDFTIDSTKRFFVKNVAFYVEVEFILWNSDEITVTITEQKADFTIGTLTKVETISIRVKTLDFLLKYFKEENDYFKNFDNITDEK